MSDVCARKRRNRPRSVLVRPGDDGLDDATPMQRTLQMVQHHLESAISNRIEGGAIANLLNKVLLFLPTRARLIWLSSLHAGDEGPRKRNHQFPTDRFDR